MALPQEVVEQDNQLEKAAELAGLKLAEHRWHWTLDESHPERAKSIAAYARDVARDRSTISRYANAYREWNREGALTDQFGDYLRRAGMSAEREEATEAVAKARGISTETARRHHAEEVRDVRATAQERAERKGTTVDEELAPVAEQREHSRKGFQAVSEREQREKAERHSWQYLKLEGKIARALRELKESMHESEGVEFTAEERELLADSISNLRALLGLFDLRITGEVEVDWDAEMAKLPNGAAS